MAGLVAYTSSDDESDGDEDVQSQPHTSKPASEPSKTSNAAETIAKEGAVSAAEASAMPEEHASAPEARAGGDDNRQFEPVPALGSAPAPAAHPMIGPSRPPDMTAGPTDPLPPPDDDSAYENGSSGGDPPLSPYSVERTAVRQLTLPRVPDFDIPNAESAQPVPAGFIAGLNTKFAKLLDMKRKRNLHLNERLANAEGMRNPALMDQMMDFVGMPPNAWGALEPDSYGTAAKSRDPKATASATAVVSAQYMTTLPADLWDPAALPAEAYRRSLQRLQEEAAKQSQRAPGERIEFVKASDAVPTVGTPRGGMGEPSASNSRADVPSSKAAPSLTTGKRKTRFD